MVCHKGRSDSLRACQQSTFRKSLHPNFLPVKFYFGQAAIKYGSRFSHALHTLRAWDVPSVTDGKALPRMLRRLQFVDEGDCKILHRDPAFAIRVAEQLITAEAECPGPLARRELGRGRQEGPVEILFRTQDIEELASGLRFPFRGFGAV